MSLHVKDDFQFFSKEELDAGLQLHRLSYDIPSQAADCFRNGAEWAISYKLGTAGKSSTTNKIFQCEAPLKNQHQTNAERIVFVCSVGMIRSPTAQIVASRAGMNARACGSNTTMALIPLNANLIEWADKIVFMQFENFQEALDTFAGTGYDDTIRDKKAVWNIEDIYDWGDNILFRILEEKVKEL